MSDNGQRETWKTLIDTFYDSETLEIRPGCDEFFEDVLSMKIAICARLAQTGHSKDALRLWDNITAKQDSSHSSDPCVRLDHEPNSNAEVSLVACPPYASKHVERNQASMQDTSQRTLEKPKDGAKAREA